jgi:hypothetical protein
MNITSSSKLSNGVTDTVIDLIARALDISTAGGSLVLTIGNGFLSNSN